MSHSQMVQHEIDTHNYPINDPAERQLMAEYMATSRRQAQSQEFASLWGGDDYRVTATIRELFTRGSWK